MKIFVLLLLSLLMAPSLLALETAPLFEEKRMDGVSLDAVETYVHPKNHEISFGLGYYPFNAYYSGFLFSGSYTHYFNNRFAWEVVNGAYSFTVDKSLSNELADDFGVNPTSIERLQFFISSNVEYVHSYGKFVLLEDTIHYFRSSILGGAGLVTTSTRSQAALSLGIRFETYINDTFSWQLTFRDLITLTGGVRNYAAFYITAGFYY